MKSVKTKLFCDIAFFAALVFKMFSLGLKYFPVLDDYIQYGGYPLYNLSEVYLGKGTIATRPFASLLDPALWGSFYPDLWVAAAIVCVLFFASAKFIGLTFEKLNIHITPFLYAVYLLLPLGFEGTYWLSASTRICVGMFFAALAAFLLAKLIETKKRKFWVPYIITCVLSCGFYESVMIVSCVLQFFVIMSLTKKMKSRIIYLITPVLSGAGMFIYYILAKNIGVMGSRVGGFSIENLWDKFSEAASQCYDIFITGGIKTTFTGALHGLRLMTADTRGVILLGIAILVSALCAYFGAKAKFYAKPSFCIPVGLLLVITPLIPNVLVSVVWLTYRNAVTSFIGIVLLFAPLFNRLFRHRWTKVTAIFLLVFLFSLSNVNELDTYRRVNQKDQQLVTQIAEQLDDAVISGEKDAVVVFPEKVKAHQVSFYKDHVLSVFESDWALTGAVRAHIRNVRTGKITPVIEGAEYDGTGKQIIHLKEN